MSDKPRIKQRRFSLREMFSATRLLPIGFFVLILIGSFLLALPVSSADGNGIGYLKALFTATSAVCVTGLSVVETGTTFSLFGQIVLIILIQIGGLGFVTLLTLIPVMLGRRITLNQRMLIREAMNENNIGGMAQLVVWAVKMTAICELAGALFLAVRFVGEFGFGKGIYYAVFHSISAFCNAGFDILGEGTSVSRYVTDPIVSLTLCALVIIGGTGFGVIHDIFRAKKFKKLRLHSKLVLSITGIMLLAGTLFVLLTEWNNPATLGVLNVPSKILAAFFQSVTLRTAGFFTVDQLMLEPATKLIGSVFMFVGAGPASAGGGMKITTVTVLVMLSISIIRGKKDVAVFGRRIPEDIIRRAMAIVMLGLAVLIAATFVVSALHPEIALIDVMYECVSALCTVGLTAAGTANYCLAAQIIIMLLMFMGRTGPMTIALAVALRQQNASSAMRMPEENITVG